MDLIERRFRLGHPLGDQFERREQAEHDERRI